jgi:glycosyltransferase involved in cell wall biosynthesis
LLRACGELKKSGVDFSFKIIGAPMSSSEKEYMSSLKNLSEKLHIESNLIWFGAVSNFKLSTHLQESDIFIHDGSTNSLDKTLVEAALCGCLVISSNPSYVHLTKEVAGEMLYAPLVHHELAEILILVSNLSPKERDLKMFPILSLFQNKYSVKGLISRIVSEFN